MSGELIITFDDGAKHENVSVAGEFTGWNPSHMHLVSGTKYSASFSDNIHAGHDYMYKFVVDGDWKLLEGHTIRTDLDGHVNHVATATIIESKKPTIAVPTPGVISVPIHKESEHHTFKELREHDRLRAQYLANEIEAAEHREKQTTAEEVAKDRAHFGSVQAGVETPIDNRGVFTETPSTPLKERENSSVHDIYDENDIPPATDPDSTIGSAYTPDKSWSSPARANAEVVGPSGVSTPPRAAEKDNGSISDLSAPATPVIGDDKPTESAVKATESTAKATPTPAEESKDTVDSKKEEKEKPKRGSLRKFFRKLLE